MLNIERFYWGFGRTSEITRSVSYESIAGDLVGKSILIHKLLKKFFIPYWYIRAKYYRLV